MNILSNKVTSTEQRGQQGCQMRQNACRQSWDVSIFILHYHYFWLLNCTIIIFQSKTWCAEALASVHNQNSTWCHQSETWKKAKSPSSPHSDTQGVFFNLDPLKIFIVFFSTGTPPPLSPSLEICTFCPFQQGACQSSSAGTPDFPCSGHPSETSFTIL